MNQDSTLTAVIPAGITDREQLFEELAVQLRFPDYFGRNWDALYDCLCDLSWLPDTIVDVVVEHRDVPALPAEELAIYRAVLTDAVQDWAEFDADMKLVVRWPEAAEG